MKLTTKHFDPITNIEFEQKEINYLHGALQKYLTDNVSNKTTYQYNFIHNLFNTITVRSTSV